MSDPYYVMIDEHDGVGRFRSTPSTAGPWAAELQHGGPPNALAVACAERALRAATERTDLSAVRLSADFVGAVPVAEIETRVRLVRVARSAALVQVVIAAAERDCLHARIWFVRDQDTTDVAPARSAPSFAIPPEPTPLEVEFGYGMSLDWRFVQGRMRIPGPAAAWVRPLTRLCDGLSMSGLARTVLVADSASGISAELDWTRWSFLNVDLDVHLARPVDGEWLLMEARTQLGPNGSAVARSVLSDRLGEFGGGLQTLILARTRTS
ncbi:MAG TPA: thioesterase family protein [Jatrophihabitans sp.]|nr:thioesterase family protein [Jatrophihabitans sp.]